MNKREEARKEAQGRRENAALLRKLGFEWNKDAQLWYEMYGMNTLPPMTKVQGDTLATSIRFNLLDC